MRGDVLFRSLSVLLLLGATHLAAAQPGVRPETAAQPRLWTVHATQRYQTASELEERRGRMAWHESTVGLSTGIFLPGVGLLRAGVDYAHVRFAFAPDLRLDSADPVPFRRVQAMRLSAQIFRPLSTTWNSQIFGAVTSTFESAALPDDALSGVVGLGVMRRFSDRLSAGLGAILLYPLGNQAVTLVPIALVDWQIADRLTFRSRRDITLSYQVDTRGRLSVAAVGALFDRRQFRLDGRGAVREGVAELKGLEVGGRVTWKPAAALTVLLSAGTTLGQELTLEDRTGRKVVDLDVDAALQLTLALRYRL